MICAGGGGIPTAYLDGSMGTLSGIEAVIDKDLASELLARDVGADLFVIATDAEGVFVDYGTPHQELLGWVTPEDLEGHAFAVGLDGAEGRGRDTVRARRRASVRLSAGSRTSPRSSRARPARTSYRSARAPAC